MSLSFTALIIVVILYLMLIDVCLFQYTESKMKIEFLLALIFSVVV